MECFAGETNKQLESKHDDQRIPGHNPAQKLGNKRQKIVFQTEEWKKSDFPSKLNQLTLVSAICITLNDCINKINWRKTFFIDDDDDKKITLEFGENKKRRWTTSRTCLDRSHWKPEFPKIHSYCNVPFPTGSRWQYSWHAPFFYWLYDMATCCHLWADLRKQHNHFSFSRLTDETFPLTCPSFYLFSLLAFSLAKLH